MNTIAVPSIIPTLKLEGSINISSLESFEERIISFCQSSTKPTIMIDMKRVELIDSSGLMVLLKALRLVESMDRRLVLAQLHPSVQIIFEITGLDEIFNIVETANQVPLAIAA